MAVEAERGYLIIAVNHSSDCDYIALAEQLSKSIKFHHPSAKTCLLTNQPSSAQSFDFVKLLPYADQGDFANDWQAWSASPFRETIKLEADMLCVSPIDHWWTLFRAKDLVISTGAVDFYHRPIQSRFYRKVFDENNLPDVYNAITYWRISHTARDFWNLVRSIFDNWSAYKCLIKFAPDKPDTDLVYAMVAQIMGPENVTMPFASYPKIVHMKPHAIGIKSKDWSQELIWESLDGGLRVNTVQQWGCFHYVNKKWQVS